MNISRLALLLVCVLLGLASCGPVPPPKNPYTEGQSLLDDMARHREKIRSFRITGRVDHFGAKHRMQGTVFLFAKLPTSLRIEIVSPFGSPLQVLTVHEGQFALHDLREGRFFTGEALPCNIAHLIRIPLPPEDVMKILIGLSPVIDGSRTVNWDRRGFYNVEITGESGQQQLHISGDRNRLELIHSRLKRADGTTAFDLSFEDWDPIGGGRIPHHIRVKMPRDKADLLLRYDNDGVEINVDLPHDAWIQKTPSGLRAEILTCN